MQAMFLFAFSSQVDLKWLLFSNVPGSDDHDGEDTEDTIFARPEPNQVAEYSITWYAGLFVLLSGFDHLFSIAPKCRRYYQYHVERWWMRSPQAVNEKHVPFGAKK